MDLSVKFKGFSSDGQAKISAASAGCLRRMRWRPAFCGAGRFSGRFISFLLYKFFSKSNIPYAKNENAGPSDAARAIFSSLSDRSVPNPEARKKQGFPQNLTALFANSRGRR